MCAQKDDFKFRSNTYEKNIRIIDTIKGTISRTVIYTNACVKKLNEEYPDSEQPKYSFSEYKIRSFNEFVVKTRSEFKIGIGFVL